MWVPIGYNNTNWYARQVGEIADGLFKKLSGERVSLQSLGMSETLTLATQLRRQFCPFNQFKLNKQINKMGRDFFIALDYRIKKITFENNKNREIKNIFFS